MDEKRLALLAKAWEKLAEGYCEDNGVTLIGARVSMIEDPDGQREEPPAAGSLTA